MAVRSAASSLHDAPCARTYTRGWQRTRTWRAHEPHMSFPFRAENTSRRARAGAHLVVQSFFDLDDIEDGRRGQKTLAGEPSGGAIPPTSTTPTPRAKFVNFASPTTATLVEKLSSFKKEWELSNGKRLIIMPLTNEMIDPTADTLTEAFGDAMGYLNTYQTFLRNQIGDYLTNHIRMLPKALVLIAVLVDASESDDMAADNALLVGTVEVSFHPSTRSKHLTLNSPVDMPYLCNMAVREAHKGNGYGSLLLDAAERVVLSTGYKCMYLHVRHVDKPALKLYQKYGYEAEGEDLGLIKLLGLDQRYLMRKYLTPKEDP